MKRSIRNYLSVVLVVVTTTGVLTALAESAFAQQAAAPSRQPAQPVAPPQPGRKAADLPPRADQKSREGQPNPRAQQARMAAAIEREYLLHFQTQVGLSNEQSSKVGSILQGFVRQQINLANRKANIERELEQKIAQQASPEDIQGQLDQMELMDKQLINRYRKFFADIDPSLTATQRARLRLYMRQTDQRIRQLIQESAQ